MAYDLHFNESVPMDWVKSQMTGLIFPDITRKEHLIKKPFIGAICADGEQAMGMVLGLTDETNKNVRLMSLKVGPKFENRGIGQKLIEFFCSEIRSRGFKSVELFYRSKWNDLEKLEHMLKKNSWGDPLFFMRHYQIEADKALAAFGADLKLHESYSLENWNAISDQDKMHIKTKYCDLPQFPDELSPFTLEQILEPNLSLFMKHNGQIVGWMVLAKVTDETLEYSALFIDPKHRADKVAPSLISEALRAQVGSGTYPKVVFSVKTSNRTMMQFLEINRQSSTIRTDVYRVLRTL